MNIIFPVTMNGQLAVKRNYKKFERVCRSLTGNAKTL